MRDRAMLLDVGFDVADEFVAVLADAVVQDDALLFEVCLLSSDHLLYV